MESSPLARASKRSSSSLQQPPNTSRRRLLDPDSQQQAWTAARCQRLLRQLQARLAALKRLQHRQFDDPAEKPKRGAIEQDRAPVVKRIRLTYGQRDARPQASRLSRSAITDATPPRPTRALRAMRPGLSSPVSGPADFRTPFWKKIRARTDTPLQSCNRDIELLDDEPIVNLPASLRDHLRSFKKTIPDESYKLHEAVFEGVHGLLRSTAPRARQIYSKSLLALCLRRIPDCIAYIQEWDRCQASSQRSSWDSPLVAFDIYEQLEEFGSQKGGWRPLGLVVRSHTISILSDAISTQFFHPTFTGLLVRLCAHFNCHEEGARLACSTTEALPEPGSLKSTLSQDDRFQPLLALFRSGLAENTTSFVFEYVATLIENQLLSGAWLCTMDFKDLWSRNLEGMVSSNAKPSIMRFKRAAMVLLARCEKTMPEPRRSVVQKTLHGILAGSTVVALNIEQGFGVGASARGKQSFRRIVFLLDSAIAQLAGSRHRNSLFVLMLARCLTVVDSRLVHECHRRQAVDDFEKAAIGFNSDAKQDGRYHSMISLICEMVLCLRRSDTFVGLGDIGDKLDRLRLPDQLVQAIRKDAAFLVAKRTKSLKDLAFAEGLPSTSWRSGWRWEEGISEWVVVQTEADRVTATRKRGLRSQTQKSVCRQPLAESRIITKPTCPNRSVADGPASRAIPKPRETPSASPPLSKGGLGGRPGTRTRRRPALASLGQSRVGDNDYDELF